MRVGIHQRYKHRQQCFPFECLLWSAKVWKIHENHTCSKQKQCGLSSYPVIISINGYSEENQTDRCQQSSTAEISYFLSGKVSAYGYINHNLISGDLPPCFNANLLTMASLNRPPSTASENNVPSNIPMNRRPWISGLY